MFSFIYRRGHDGHCYAQMCGGVAGAGLAHGAPQTSFPVAESQSKAHQGHIALLLSLGRDLPVRVAAGKASRPGAEARGERWWRGLVVSNHNMKIQIGSSFRLQKWRKQLLCAPSCMSTHPSMARFMSAIYLCRYLLDEGQASRVKTWDHASLYLRP